MPEVEQRAGTAGLAFVLRHDPRLGGNAGGDGAFGGSGVEGDDGPAVLFEPVEKAAITEHAVFENFGITGAKFAFGQRAQRAQIGQHQRRLVERADQILARRGVDRGLAADRTVDLRQQRGGQLHEAAAALEDRAGKAGQVADHAAAQREDMVAAFDTLIQQPVGQPGETVPALRCFAGRDIVPARFDARGRKRIADGFAPVSARVGIGHDAGMALAQEGPGLRCQIGQQPVADTHFVAPAGQFDGNYSHASIALRMLSAVSVCGASSVTTWTCASA